MKSCGVQNVVADETNEVSYEVTARRRLTDGEVYIAIRVPLLKFGANV